MQNCFLIHYGEISLKGKNQPQFRKQLLKNIALSLSSIGIDWPVKQFRGYLLLKIEDQSKIEVCQERSCQGYRDKLVFAGRKNGIRGVWS